MTIQSNQVTASGHASAIAAGASLMTGATVSKDETSSFATNDALKGFLDQEVNAASQLAGQLGQFVGLVQTTAQEFATTDKQIAAQLQFWQSTETLNKATASTREVGKSAPLSGTERSQKAGFGLPS